MNENTGITYATISDIVDSVLTQFSAANIVAMLGGIIGGVVGIRFLWWSLRKAFRAVMGTVTGGKMGV